MNVTDFLNSTNVLRIYVEPSDSRHLDQESGYKDGDLNLPWSINDYKDQILSINISFNNPTEISP